MSEEEKQEQATPKAPASAGDAAASLRTVVIGSSVVVWILAIWMINTLNTINEKLSAIDQSLQATMSASSGQRPVESYQVTDKDGNLVYKFRLDPALEVAPEDMMDPAVEAGMMGGAAAGGN